MITLGELIELRRALPATVPGSRESLAERFLLPPFTVLNARQGYWQDRKNMWLAIGIKSELGRGETPSFSARVGPDDEATYRTIGGKKHSAAPGGGAMPLVKGVDGYVSRKANATPGGSLLPSTTLKDGKTQRGDGKGRAIPGDGKKFAKAFNMGMNASKENDWAVEDNQGSGTSIFDPVLCELAYRWFCPQAGRVLDPFAGGSVRGIVAARLGRAYAGMDLREEQVGANYEQAELLCPDADLTWAVGDSQGIAQHLPGQYDLVFSCPPYADLERYSDDPRDLSTMSYEGFLEAYRVIIRESCAMLRDDRFAVFVVGDVRDRVTGNYRGFVGDTVEAFRAAGLGLYNEAVLVTSVGSLPIRVGRQFAASRKLGKTHQNVLVFVKGDAARATVACGEVDTDDLDLPGYIEGGVAVCRDDAVGTIAAECLMGNEGDVAHVYLPPTESYLLCDVLRGQAVAAGVATPRMWLGRGGAWARVEDGVDLTYVVDGTAYLNQTVFPSAPPPPATKLVPQKLRGT